MPRVFVSVGRVVMRLDGRTQAIAEVMTEDETRNLIGRLTQAADDLKLAREQGGEPAEVEYI